MIKHHRHLTLLAVCAIVGGLLIASFLSTSSRVDAQTATPTPSPTCTNPNPLGRSAAWQQNARISVNISGFPTHLRPCLERALSNWNAANAASGNGFRRVLPSTYLQPFAA
jgi:hypothetical protein